jgi:hypothetical protein
MRQCVVLPTKTPDPENGSDYLSNFTRNYSMKYILSNSLSFGGQLVEVKYDG